MKYYIVLLSFLLFLPISRAKVHIEPYGSVGGSYSSSVSSSPLFLNYGLGARLGYNFSFLSAGLDLFWTHYNIGSSSSVQHLEVYHSTEPTKGFNQAGESLALHYSEVREPFQPFSLGAFVVVDLPFLFNTYGTVFYTFGKKTVNHQGYGVKAGLSYLSAYYVQVNLELQWANYTCSEPESEQCSSGGFDILSVALSLSVPISTHFFDFGREDTEEDSEEDSDSSDTESAEDVSDDESGML